MSKPLLIGLGLLALLGTAAAQTNPAQIVQERRDGLRAVGTHMEAMAAIARAGGDPRPAAERVAAVQAFFVNFPDRFPAGTARGTAGLDTRALPEIWTDRANFERVSAALGPRLEALNAAAQSGDARAFGAALQATGASCGDCHRPFRAR
ncbi:MAG TPA: cytochrome c [Roseococcus sp.]|jgi:cytochrome c556|nr:cytochrome c [Roseococcus sp.]